MITEQKSKQIQRLIKNSKVLSEQEKIEWQALLELMNDKQVVELEEILTPKSVEPKPVASTDGGQSSSLSHISNLPSQLSIHKTSPETLPTTPSSAPAPKPLPRPVAPIVSRPDTSPPLQSRPAPVSEPTPVQPNLNPIQSTAVSSGAAQPITLSSLSDVAMLSSNALHQQNRQVFYKTINDFAAQFGYFQVVTSFEQSPLYKDYLDYGKSMLAGQKDGLALSHEEFEFVTDILLSLKVNRF
jgi:hypothetical protein